MSGCKSQQKTNHAASRGRIFFLSICTSFHLLRCRWYTVCMSQAPQLMTNLSNITAKYGNGVTGQIECLTVAFHNACRNWHSSQLQMFKDDMESTAALLINKYGVSPEGLDEIDQRYAARYSA